MGYISSTLVLRILVLIRFYVAYLLLTAPSALLSQNLVLMLSSSMRLPTVTATTSALTSSTATSVPSFPTPATALAALALGFYALSDLSATALPEFAYDEYWSIQSMTRVLVYLGTAAWIYLTKPAGTVLGVVEDAGFGKRPGDGLRNGLVFSWCFVEMTATSWVFIQLREERKERAMKVMAEREKKEEAERRGM